MQKTGFSKRIKYAAWRMWENARGDAEMVKQTNVILKTDTRNRVKEEVVLSSGALECMTRRNNMRHLRVEKTPVLRWREPRVFARGNELTEEGQVTVNRSVPSVQSGVCSSLVRSRKRCSVWTDLRRIVIMKTRKIICWQRRRALSSGYVELDNNMSPGNIHLQESPPKPMVGSRRRNYNEVRDESWRPGSKMKDSATIWCHPERRSRWWCPWTTKGGTGWSRC